MIDLGDIQRCPPGACVSVVLPVFNESAILTQLCDAIVSQLDRGGWRYEIIFVNDGSTDESPSLLDRLADENTDVRVLHLSRNFGHQAAVQAGLAHAHGDAVVLMDSDLQDDPQYILPLIAKWQAGYDVVYAVRTKRTEAMWKRLLFFSFYRLLRVVTSTSIPNDAGIFGLMDRRVVAEINRIGDYDRFFPGLRHWVGFRQTELPVERRPRHDKHPRVSLLQLFQLAKTAFISFSSIPLTLFYLIAAVSISLCCMTVGFTCYHRFISGQAIPGWTSITITASFFGALNALGIGVLGEYVVRIYDQVRKRPNFIVATTRNMTHCDPDRVEDELLMSVTNLLSTSQETIGTPCPEAAKADGEPANELRVL